MTNDSHTLKALPAEVANLARLALFVRENARSREEAINMLTAAIQADLMLRSLFYEQGRACLRFMDKIAPSYGR